MRTDGVDERFCTGDAEPYEKFLAWAKTVPHTLRNPLYHWTHLELKRYFDIDRLLSERTAKIIWEEANERLQTPELSTRGILKKFRVIVQCTTDDPTDSLESHQAIQAERGALHVYPTFRPDKAVWIADAAAFQSWCGKLEAASQLNTDRFGGFLDALRQRHDFFHAVGCRLSDHGLERCFDDFCDDATAASIFDKARAGTAPSPEETRQFASWMMIFLGQLDAAKGWTKQLHLGALRNNNTRLLTKLGLDTGFDSIGDFPQAQALSRYLDRLDRENALPKTIIYNLNPADNYAMAAMIGNFQDGSIAGKVQFGSGWWFLDQKEAMEWQMNALSNLGLLYRFVGMVTDSRSFMSFPRHEYFRRVLCNLIGRDVERGLIPDDWELYSRLVKNVCYRNAERFFGLNAAIG
jgi:glucuronate isomerase